jgi:hypothetical protein
MKNILLSTFILFLFVNCTTTQKTVVNTLQNTKTEVAIDTNKVVFTKKYGLKFVKPETWELIDEDIQSVNLKGEIMSLETKYIDLQNNLEISLKLHPGQRGKSLYKYYKNDLNSRFKVISIDNKEGLQKTELLNTDGKGKTLEIPITRIITNVLVSDGETEIVINAKNKNAVGGANRFLSSIVFK